MTNEETQTQTQTESAENTNAGSKPTPIDIVGEARTVREELGKTLEETKKIVEELRILRANEILGGTTNSTIPQQQAKEESAKEYAERMLRGG